ncbi:alpha/beta hydrolase [Natronomonas salsuginis]|jgi:acetyl esterase|uniref:Alpha/beta hydrolase n=1 Tax=Natronomonas salsuginis TaxID=2217661 RepID=A0A4U5J799_9EURY|nr:alpha/beta hydrolase [Natronomonas salsuginis]TKR24912.1 alpha/beta hydrolase [Natronomonas salsuginis]
MPPRDKGLDPQAAALLDQLESGISPPSSTLSVETGRELLDELFTVADPEPVEEVTDIEIGGPNGPIPLRIYAPETEDGPDPVLAFIHGGGWVRGSLDAYDGLCRRLANRAETIVVSIDYRLAPEHPFPTGFEDSYAATEWAATHAADLGGDPERVAVGGDSAGGNHAAAIAIAARDRDGPDLAHQLLVYPAVNPPSLRWFDAYDENGTDYFLEMDSVEWYYDQYRNAADIGNHYAFPLRARDLSGLPSATVMTAGYDPLRDEGEAYAERLDEAGVETDYLHYEAQIHAFVSLYEYLDEGKVAIDDAAEALRSALGVDG